MLAHVILIPSSPWWTLHDDIFYFTLIKAKLEKCIGKDGDYGSSLCFPEFTHLSWNGPQERSWASFDLLS